MPRYESNAERPDFASGAAMHSMTSTLLTWCMAKRIYAGSAEADGRRLKRIAADEG